jgi:hypothetical protein
MTKKRLTYPLKDIKKLLHQGLSKEEVLQIVFQKYENTIHHTDYWKYQLQGVISKVDSELNGLNVKTKNHRRRTSKKQIRCSLKYKV